METGLKMIYLTPVIFFFLSFIFSMLGMGGGQIYIPILFWLGMDFKMEAIPLGLLLNFCVQISAFTTYARNRLVDFKIALPFALSMIISAPLGAVVNFRLSPKPIILLFSLFTFFAGLLAISGYKPKKKISSRKAKLFLGFFAGSVLGFLVGLIGRGGGSFIVPTLLVMGLDAKVCVGTSTFIASFSSLIGFLSHLFHSRLNLIITILTVGSVILGSQLGSRFMVARIKSKTLKKIFGWVLILISILLVKSVFR